MNVAEYLTDFLIQKKVKDVFGIPGTIMLDFLYALDQRPEIEVHLSCHEQCSAFEACGYAQKNYSLGVAYATKGPGFTNLITGIAEAYSDSLPVMFITAHGKKSDEHKVRFVQNQELDTISMVNHITKYAALIDDADAAVQEIERAYRLAMMGRKGPVLLDFAGSIWKNPVPAASYVHSTKEETTADSSDVNVAIQKIILGLKTAQRPLLLIGDGISQSNTKTQLLDWVAKVRIPVISSYCSQDIMSGHEQYYGYIGSHGIRYGNFVFGKADFVVSLGNRMFFPSDSKSFIGAVQNKSIIRVDIDDSEFSREIPNTKNFKVDLRILLPELLSTNIRCGDINPWLTVCKTLKEELESFDINSAVSALMDLLKSLPSEVAIVSDIGCSAFWLARAYEAVGAKNRMLRSKSFSSLGCGIGKAIGASIVDKSPVLCIVGDHGIQLNIQELQVIAHEKLPIIILLMNNNTSGIIRLAERGRFGNHYVQTTLASGYHCPNFKKVAESYGVRHYYYCEETKKEVEDVLRFPKNPCLIEISLPDDLDLTPVLPIGNLCQRLVPELPGELYNKLERL